MTVGPAIVPYSASLDQVLTVLKALALSTPMATEIANYKAVLAAQPSSILVNDANGAQTSINVGNLDSDLSYIADSFSQVSITSQQKVLLPWPFLELVGRPGRVQQGITGDRFTADTGLAEGEVYTVDAYAWAGTSDDPRRVQLEAMALIYCFKMLVKRNEQLNGLVQLIQPVGPTEPLGSLSPQHEGTTIMGAAARFEVYVLLP